MLLADHDLIPAIGYLRVSAWFEEKISDEIQKAVIQDAARRRGRRIVHWIPDLDATGRNFKRRIMEAITLVETGAMEGAREIWVWKYSRFGRNRHGVAINLARVEQSGGFLISATEDLDATTATGKFTRGMLFEIAAFESDRIGETWRETHAHRRLLGLPSTGGQRFGYFWTPRLDAKGKPQQEKYLPNPETAPGLVEVYERYAEGGGFLTLAKHLNGQGLRNPGATTQAGWSLQSLSQYLDGGFAAGYLHVHDPDVACPNRARCRSSGEHYIHIPGAQPPVVDSDLWAAYKQRRDQRQRIAPRARIPKYPFSGVAKCGLCNGGAGAYNVDGRRGAGWRCTRALGGSGACRGANVTTRRLVAMVKEWLSTVEQDLDALTAGTAVHPAASPQPDTTAARERLTEQVRQAAQALDAASRSLAKGIMPEDSYLRVRDELRAEQQQAETALTELVRTEPVEPGRPTPDQIAVVRRLSEEWGQLPVPVVRDMLLDVMAMIKIWPKGREPRIEIVPAWSILAV